MSTGAAVILVHGLFYGRGSMRLLAWRLQRHGFRAECFAYRPTRDGLDASATALANRAREIDAPGVHFAGHSFGGLVILKALEDAAALPPGRAVLLGSPVQGSRVAAHLLRWTPGQALLRAAGPPLAAGHARIPPRREIGMIAGTAGLGLGRLAGARLGPSDGTVGIDEADAAGLADRLLLPVSHTGMLFSRRVAEAASRFLLRGRFEAPAGAPA